MPLIVCFLHDITEIRRREERQKALIIKLEQLYAELNEFSDIIDETKDTEQIVDHTDYGMSKIDNEIIRFVNHGCRNKEIAQALGIAEITVKKHLSALYRKTGTTRRYELIKRFENFTG